MRVAVSLIAVTAALLLTSPAIGRQKISNDLSRCTNDATAVLVTVQGIRKAQGMMRAQSYRATKSDWLKKGRWLKRIETRATGDTMKFCIPVDDPGTYAIAIRHDVNGNGKTDIFEDGGGMSNDPSISIWNLGKPSYKKVAFRVDGSIAITITMKYM